MDFEQILIRLGLDAKALTSGLTRTTSWVKGWATGLMSDLQHHVLGRFAGLYVFERVFEGIKEKALFVQRTAKETGLSTNMIQGMANELGYVGESFEGVSKPLGKFNVLLGQAKSGSMEARSKLVEWGIATRNENWGALNLAKGLDSVSKQFDALGNHEQKAALLFSVFGKGYQQMFPIFELGRKRVAELDKGNFFTKLSPQSLETFQTLFKTGKMGGSMALSFAGNLADLSLTPLINGLSAVQKGAEFVAAGFGSIHKGAQMKDMLDNADKLKEKEHETNEEFVDRLKLQEEINNARKLENEIEDRGKLTVHQLAARGRAILGDRSPRGLERIQAITPAMANAMQVENMELAGEEANARGQFANATGLRSRADQLRGTNFALKSTERDPTLDVRNRLEAIHDTLERSGIKVKEINGGSH